MTGYGMNVTFRKTDMDYLEKRGLSIEDATCPVLENKGRHFGIRVSFNIKSSLPEIKERILAVDIGINNAAVMAVMDSRGTVLGRNFVVFQREEDRLRHILNSIKAAHSDTKCRTHRLNRYAMNYSEALSIMTSRAIVEFAAENQCDCIVMEKLKIGMGKAHGSKAMRLSYWRRRDIEKRVEMKAHVLGMRFSTVTAANTSKLAYDGSGPVVRDKDNRSLCTFKTGKRYNTDLSASYNIGARYFVREIWKSLSETAASKLKAKVPGLWYGTQCTLSTLIDLNAVMASA